MRLRPPCLNGGWGRAPPQECRQWLKRPAPLFVGALRLKSSTAFRALAPTALFRWITKPSLRASLSAKNMAHSFRRAGPLWDSSSHRLTGARSAYLDQRLLSPGLGGANGPEPLRRLPVYHLPVMLTQHLHGVVG